jgi:hypothetical protein
MSTSSMWFAPGYGAIRLTFRAGDQDSAIEYDGDLPVQ